MGLSEDLLELKKLNESGVLTDAEFAEQKQRILNTSSAAEPQPVQRPQVPNPSDQVASMLLPINRPMSAIAAGYLGLLSLLPFIGILAVIVGCMALSKLKASPELQGSGRAWFGIISGGLTTLLYLFIFLGNL